VPKFRKKPVEVEAEQFGGFYATPHPAGVGMDDNSNHPERGERYAFFVVTAHGHKTPIEQGDWIITEPDGRGHYPCKPDIFAATYEAV
jgi:hypothetical protein